MHARDCVLRFRETLNVLGDESDPRGFWQPDVTVASVVVRNGAFLIVEEDVQGQRVLNQPAGHLEPDESLLHAAVRETLEESGWEVEPTALIGCYQWKSPANANEPDGRYFLRVAVAATPLRHFPDRALDNGIVRALWLTPAQLQAEAARHRSPLVWRVVQDYLGGQRLPLAALAHLS
jgi:8-oxo-dGTP pyrophosphatase MutT (NUDIX family)